MSSAKLETVADVMTRKLVTVTQQDVVGDIDQAMHRLRLRHMPVLDAEGKLVGLVSHPDLMHAASSFLSDREQDRNALIAQVSVGMIMQREVLTVQPDDLLVEAGKLMWESKIGSLPVVDPEGHLVGIITEADFIAIALQLLGSEIKKPDCEGRARGRRAPPAAVM